MNSKFTSKFKSVYHTNCENLWVQLNLAGSKSVLIGAYYKQHESEQTSFEELIKSLTLVNQTKSTDWLLWDFNLPKVDWENLKPLPDCGHPTFYREGLEALNDCLLQQTVTSPTRGQNILDLFFTTNPTLVENVSIIPGISDHDIVLAKVNAKPEISKQVPCTILLYKKADWDQLKQSMRDLHSQLTHSLTLPPPVYKVCGIGLLPNLSKV